MKPFVIKWQQTIAVAAVVSAELICALCFGWKGFLGMGIGIAATWLNVWALWRAILVFGDTMRGTPSASRHSQFAVTAFLLKLPILIGLGLFTRFIGGAALPCFVGGLGMVYFGLVGWASART